MFSLCAPSLTVPVSLDNNLFEIVLYELKNGSISYDPDKMDSLFYNPILDRDTHLRARIADLDPDMNHLNYIGNCEFSTVDELNERLFANLSFSVLHLNARSLVKNHEDLSHLLANINHKFSVLAITETWIKDDEPYDLKTLMDIILLVIIALVEREEESAYTLTKN